VHGKYVSPGKYQLMEKYYQGLQRLTLPVVCVLLMAGCVKDDCKHTYKIYTPVYKTLTQLRSEVKSGPARALVNPGKIYIKDNFVYLNEQGQGIHVIDNSNPQQPINKAFINIPGNVDIAMKENILYANMHCDLAAFDVSNPTGITLSKYVTRAFPSQAGYTNSTNPDSIKVIVSWNSRDTVLSCDSYNYLNGCTNCGIFFSAALTPSASQSATSSSGVAGSMAAFATVGDYLYGIDWSNMSIIDIASAANPLFVKRQYLTSNAETVYSFKNNLFIGTPVGMAVYNIQNPVNLVPVSWSGHWMSCDPVIADDKYAYVTLHDGAICRSTARVNQLDVYDIGNITKPVLVKSYPLTNPHGLSKDANLLFVCDGADGLKIFDAADAQNIKELKHFEGIDTYDVITLNGIAYVVAKDGLYQYDYSNIATVHLLSKLKWNGSTK